MKLLGPRQHFAAAVAVSILACLTLIPLFPFLLPQPRAQRLVVGASAAAGRDAKVLVFILDGVGARVSLAPGSMPLLQARLSRSAYGIAEATFPTITPAGLRAILAGRRGPPEPEFPDAPAMHEPDSVFRQATLAGLTAIGIGQQQWPKLFGDHGADFHILPYRGHTSENYDAEEYQMALRLMRERHGRWNLFVVHFFGSDPLAHIYGTEGPIYRARVREQDRYVDSLARLAGPEATVIVTSDHGQMPTGEHGGISPEETDATFVMWGRRVRPGKIAPIQLRQIAPTIAVLLGMRPPLMSDETPLFDLLSFSRAEKERALVSVFEQKSAQWSEIRRDWPWLSGNPAQALARVHELAQQGRWPQAAELSSRGTRVVEQALLKASPNRWYGRFILSEALLVLACGLLAVGRLPQSGRWSWLLAAVIVLSLALPCLDARLWHLSALSCLAAGGAGLVAALWSRHRLPAADRTDWVAFVWGIGILALPSIVDLSLWGWLALALVIWRRRAARQEWKAAAALLAFAWWIGPTQAPSAGSLLRSLLPLAQTPARWVTKLPIGTFLAPVCALFWSTLPKEWRGSKRAAATAAAGAPMLLVSLLMRWAPGADAYPMIWVVLLGSLCLWAVASVPRISRCLWLALLLLAYHRSLSFPGPGARLMLGVVLGWALSRGSERLSALWRGLEIMALALWTYDMAGYTFDFSQISVTAGYATLGASWHPFVLIGLITLRQLAALGAPVLPLLTTFDEDVFVSTAAIAGAWSAGNLLSLWVTRFWGGQGLQGIGGDEFTARALWAAVMVWALLGWRLIAAFRGLRPTSVPAS